MKKGHVIILLSFLLLLVLAGAYSYSKYTTDVTGNAEIKIAKWNISVNGCPGDESGAIECSTSTEGNDYTVNVVVGNDSTKQIITFFMFIENLVLHCWCKIPKFFTASRENFTP